MAKRILFLGAARAQLPPIRYAREQGHYVITCDYLPQNPGHRLADEWHNVSTTDQDAVLSLAKRRNVDAIVAYASDPSAPTAAYVAERLGLPGHPYESVLTLARKDRFRPYLRSLGLNSPQSVVATDASMAKEWLRGLDAPAFVKPADSSGSKGITLVTDASRLDAAYSHASRFSKTGTVILEERIHRKGYQVDSDVFMVDGKLKFWAWGDQHQNPACNPYAPICSTFPSTLDSAIGEKAAALIETVLRSLRIRTGAFNVEFIIDEMDQIWILEIGPRNGGKNIPIALQYATGVDLVKATVDAALGESCDEVAEPKVSGFWSNFTIHSERNGKFRKLMTSPRVRRAIVEQDLWVKPGDLVNAYRGSQDTLGLMILQYASMEEMLEIADGQHHDVACIVD